MAAGAPLANEVPAQAIRNQIILRTKSSNGAQSKTSKMAAHDENDYIITMTTNHVHSGDILETAELRSASQELFLLKKTVFSHFVSSSLQIYTDVSEALIAYIIRVHSAGSKNLGNSISLTRFDIAPDSLLQKLKPHYVWCFGLNLIIITFTMHGILLKINRSY